MTALVIARLRSMLTHRVVGTLGDTHLRTTAALMLAALCLANTAVARDTTAPDSTSRIRTQLVARHDVEISSEVAARIAKLPLKEGEAFSKGDLLVAFDCGLYRARLTKAVATAAAARRAQEVSQKLAALHSAGALDVAQVKARAKEAKADAAYMRTMVGKCTIHAPFSGRVAKRHASPYEYVTPGKPLLEILDTGALVVKLNVPSTWLTWLKPGAEFTVHVDDLGADYPAQVERLGARIDAVSQTVDVSGRILGAPPELLPGMSGWARFPGHP